MPSAMTLDQLVALSDELAALARLGVPLELGLRELRRDVPGRVRRSLDRLRQRLESGEDLAQVVATSPDVFPPAYQAVVQAGIHSGRLSLALEQVAASARQLAAMRRSRSIAMIYPVLLVLVGYAVFMFTISAMSWPTEMIGFRRSMGLPPLPWLNWLETLGTAVRPWVYWPPLIFLGLVALLWLRTRLTRRYPWRKLRDAAALATFSELLAVMVEQGIRLDKAIGLAAQASDSDTARRFADQWIEHLQSGERHFGTADAGSGRLAPWLMWLVSLSAEGPQLSANLRQAARYYRERLASYRRWYAHTLPVLLTLAIGAAGLVLLTVTIWAPFYHTLYSLGIDIG